MQINTPSVNSSNSNACQFWCKPVVAADMSPLIVQYPLKMQSQIQGLIQEELHALELFYIIYVILDTNSFQVTPHHPSIT